MESEGLAQADKGAHDGDVDTNRRFAAQDSREHGDTLLGKNAGQIAPATRARL